MRKSEIRKGECLVSSTNHRARERQFVPALRLHTLTPAYDTVVRLTTRERAVKEALLQAAHLDSASRLLDIGSGTGTFAVLAKRHHPHLEVVGVDPDPSVLRRARAKAERAQADVTFIEGSALDLPLPDEAFDRVTSSLMFHHLTAAQKRRAVGEVSRVLTVGGEFHLADWVRSPGAIRRALFWSVRLLDGLETTREHANGGLTDLLRLGGLSDVVQHRSIDAPIGTVGLISAHPSAGLSTGAGSPAG